MKHYYIDLIPIGNGSFCVSCKAKRKSYNVEVCLKYSNIIHDDERMEYEKEILVLSTMKHENIMNYISHFYDENRICIEMEHANGGNLGKRSN
jgi:NIMA (never in mitosis gene a)-related kinase